MHKFTTYNYTSSGLDRNNCRNPNVEHHSKVWCFTISKRTQLDYCLVEECTKPNLELYMIKDELDGINQEEEKKDNNGNNPNDEE